MARRKAATGHWVCGAVGPADFLEERGTGGTVPS